jgi:hypothetical protein
MNSTRPAPAEIRRVRRRLLAADPQEISAALAQALHWLAEDSSAALPPQADAVPGAKPETWAGPGRGDPALRP